MRDSRGDDDGIGARARVDMRPDAVRYYERIGLMEPPVRTAGDHRSYDQTAVDRLLFIQGMQPLGLRLADFRGLLALRETGACAPAT